MSATLQDQIYAIVFLPDYIIPLVFMFTTTVEFFYEILFILVAKTFLCDYKGFLGLFIQKLSAIL